MNEPALFLDGKVRLHCGGCGTAFVIAAARIKHGRGKYCSAACQYAAASRPRNQAAFTCIGCGAGFAIPQSKAVRKGGGKYCTRACRDQHWVGAKNPNWQNGDCVYKRGSHWQAIRRRILARDKTCRHCGSAGELHVHHKIPFRVFGDKDAANSDWNLIALCPPCHRKEDARYKWAALQAGALQFQAGGAAWQLAKERGMV